MDLVNNEILLKEVSLGQVRIELSVHQKDGWTVWLTARDHDNRRIWRTQLTDDEGHVKVYPNVHEAVLDAQSQLNSILSVADIKAS